MTWTFSNLTTLHHQTQHFDKAEQEYIEALGIWRRLAEKNTEALESNVAATLNTLASLHCKTQRFDKSEQEYSEVPEIYRRLAKKNPDAFDNNVAMTLVNYACKYPTQ